VARRAKMHSATLKGLNSKEETMFNSFRVGYPISYAPGSTGGYSHLTLAGFLALI